MTYPVIILHEPQMGENIGAAARVMLNFGLTDLRLVAPRDGWPNDAAIANGAGAFDHLTVSVFDDVERAIADLDTVYATSARRRDLNIPVFRPQQVRVTRSTGIVFGRERTGLENKHVARMNGVIELPVNPDFPSLNLAQAVGVTVYALCGVDQEPPSAHGEETASHSEVQNLQSRLEEALDARGFFRTPAMRPKLTDDLRCLIGRINPTEQETRLMHGIISALVGNKTAN